MLKHILAGIAGIAMAMIVIIISEMYLEKLMPGHILYGLLAGYAIACFAGGAVATRVVGGQAMRPALIVGVVVMIGGIMNLTEIHHPLWFVIISQFMYVPFAYMGYLIFRK